MKRLFIAIILIAAPHFLGAQNKSIIGTVVDSETKESISGAVISLDDKKSILRY